jgi:hypothetical protein
MSTIHKAQTSKWTSITQTSLSQVYILKIVEWMNKILNRHTKIRGCNLHKIETKCLQEISECFRIILRAWKLETSFKTLTQGQLKVIRTLFPSKTSIKYFNTIKINKNQDQYNGLWNIFITSKIQMMKSKKLITRQWVNLW